MNESEWLTSDDPVAMLRWLTVRGATPDAADPRVGRVLATDRQNRPRGNFIAWKQCPTCKGTGHAPAVHCRGDWVLDLCLGKS